MTGKQRSARKERRPPSASRHAGPGAKKAKGGASRAKAPAKSPPVRRPTARKSAKPEAKAPAPKTRPPLQPVASSTARTVAASGVTVRTPTSPQLRVGDDVPTLTRGPLSRVDVARYCAASGNFNVIALDEPHARAVGLPTTLVPGGYAYGLAGACLSSWARDDGRVLRFGARCVKMIWPGDQLLAKARVAELRPAGDGREIDLDVWVENQKGELLLRGKATVQVRTGGSPRGGEFFGLPVPASAPAAAPSTRPAAPATPARKPSRR